MNRFVYPKFCGIESNLPNSDVIIQHQTTQFAHWNDLPGNPVAPKYRLGSPTNFHNFNYLEQRLPIHTYNRTGAVQFQAPLDRYPGFI
jgi:hypothetical protein